MLRVMPSLYFYSDRRSRRLRRRLFNDVLRRLRRDPYDRAPARLLLAKHAALQSPSMCTFGAADLEIDKDVFNPTLTKVSPLLLKAIAFRRGESMLDAFSGSGAFGINAARAGASKVVAFDISPLAVDCALKNARLNKVEQIIDVRLGTVHSCVKADESFDLIVANPPLLPGDPKSSLEAAIYDHKLEATFSFIRALPRLLAPQGRCYLLTSDVLERVGGSVEDLCAGLGLIATVARVQDEAYESYRVHLITRG